MSQWPLSLSLNEQQTRKFMIDSYLLADSPVLNNEVGDFCPEFRLLSCFRFFLRLLEEDFGDDGMLKKPPYFCFRRALLFPISSVGGKIVASIETQGSAGAETCASNIL